MTRQARRSPKSPRPKTPLGRRLEDVRRLVGAPSVLEFYNRLTAEGGLPAEFPGYDAALTYHGPTRKMKREREAPSAYLARVVEVFPYIDAQWLLTGAGEPVRRLPVEATWRDAIHAAFNEAVGGAVGGVFEAWPSLIERIEEFVGRAEHAWIVAGAADKPRGDRESFEARRLHLREDVATTLGRLFGESVRGMSEGPISDARLQAFAVRYLIAAEEMIPVWIRRYLW